MHRLERDFNRIDQAKVEHIHARPGEFGNDDAM